MNLEKHNRTVTLLCPSCRGTQFSHPEAEDASKLITCTSCGHQTTRDDLITANRAQIDGELDKVKAAVVQDVRDEIKKTLSRAFSGNKNIRFKL